MERTLDYKAKEIGYRTYEEYLRSNHWRAKKKEYYSKKGRYCKKCGNKEKLYLHHKHYNSLGKESLSDLISLCHVHHMVEHKRWFRNKKIGIKQSIGFNKNQLWTGRDQIKTFTNSPIKTYFVDPKSLK